MFDAYPEPFSWAILSRGNNIDDIDIKIASLVNRVDNLEKERKASVPAGHKVDKEVLKGALSRGSEQSIKIGDLVKRVFRELIGSRKLSADVLLKLQDKDYCKSTLGINYPILKRLDNTLSYIEQRMVNGYPRYWKEIVYIDGGSYILCNDWYERNRDGFISWYALFDKNAVQDMTSQYIAFDASDEVNQEASAVDNLSIGPEIRIVTKEEIVDLFYRKYGIKFSKMKGKKTLYEALCNGKRILLYTPESKLNVDGLGWIDISITQRQELEAANISIVAYRIEGSNVYFFDFISFKDFLTPDAIINSSSGNMHWKTHVGKDYIRVQKNDNIFKIIPGDMSGIERLFESELNLNQI